MGQNVLIYTFVARGTVILTEFSGNFNSIAFQCLQKLPATNNKFTHNCDGHTFNYLVDNGFKCIGEINQISVGENLSPTRAKGYSIASLAVLPGVKELEGLDLKQELAKAENDKVREHLESVIVLDYVIRSPQSASL